MKKLACSVLGVAVVLVLTACGKKGETPLEPMPASQEAAQVGPAAVPASTPTAAPSYRDTLSWKAGRDKHWSQRGRLVDSKLVNDSSMDGYVLFGPYAPFKAGQYTVAIQGTADTVSGNGVHLDVSSGKGKVSHGGIDVTTAGRFPTFDVNVAQDVSDLEVRVLVRKGNKVTVESYEVTKKL